MKRKNLWENDEKLEKVRKFLYSQDSWLNKLETEFVRQSVIRKRQGEDILSLVVTLVAIVVTVLAVWALYKQREANIKKVDALRESAEEELKSNNDLQATIDILQAYRTLDDKTSFPKPDKEKTEVQRTLHKVFYEVRERNRIQVNRGSVYDMALSPDGTKLVTIGVDDTVILWDTSGKQLDQFKTGQNKVRSVAFSPDSQLIATGGYDGTVRLWEIDDNNNVKQWLKEIKTPSLDSEQSKTQLQNDIVYSVAFINKDKNVDKNKYKLATIGEDDKVRVWDISSNKKELEISTKQKNIRRLAFSSQKNLLAIVGGDNQLRLCQFVYAGEKAKSCNFLVNKTAANQDIFYRVAFTSRGQLVTASGQLATGGENGKIELWEIDNNNNVKLSKNQPDYKEIEQEQGTIYSLGGSTNKLATLGADGTVILRQPSGKQILPIRPPERIVPNNSVAFSPDGKLLATANDDGVVQLWDSSGKRLSRILTGQGSVNSVVFSPDPKQPFIVTGGKDGTIILWDISGNKLDAITTQQKEVVSVVFNPKNPKQLATVGEDRTLKWWQISKDESGFHKLKRQPIKTITTQLPSVKNAVFTPNNEWLITLTNEGKVQLWKDSEKPEDLLEDFQVNIKSLALSPDGNKLAIGGNNGAVWVWNGSPAHKPVRLLQTQQGSIDALAYTLDGKLATVSEDGTLKLWETSSNRRPNRPIELPLKEQGIQGISSIAFSSDSDKTRLATVGEDGVVSLWDTSNTSGKPPKPTKDIPTELDFASSVALSPDGKFLVVGGESGKVKLFDTSSNKLLDEIPLEPGVVTSLSFSSDNKLLVTLEENNQSKTLWRVETIKDNTRSSSNALKLSNKGKLAGVDKEGIVKVYSGDPSPEEVPTQQGGISSLALSSDGELLATAGNDGSLRLGNTKGTQFDTIPMLQSPTLQDQIKSVVFSPDGKLLATIGNNKVKLWRISEKDSTIENNTLNPLQILSKLLPNSEKDYKLNAFKTLENTSNVAFSTDGKLLATVDENRENRKVTLWEIGGDKELVEGICTWVRGYLEYSPNLSESDRKLCDGILPSTSSLQTTIANSPAPSIVQPPVQNTSSPTPPSNNRQPPNRNQASSLNSTSVDTYINQGLTYYRKGNYQQAISSYNQAIALNSNSATAYSNRAAVYNEQKDYQKAITDSSKAISLKPTYVNAYINRGIAYYRQGNYKEAITDYGKAIKYDRNNANAYKNRALAYTRLGNQQAAQADKRKAADLSRAVSVN